MCSVMRGFSNVCLVMFDCCWDNNLLCCLLCACAIFYKATGGVKKKKRLKKKKDVRCDEEHFHAEQEADDGAEAQEWHVL